MDSIKTNYFPVFLLLVGLRGPATAVGQDAEDHIPANQSAYQKRTDGHTTQTLQGPCPTLGLSGVRYQTSQQGTYHLLNITCKSRVAYKHGEGDSYLYYVDEASWTGWMVGSSLCSRLGSLSVSDDVKYPQDIDDTWREAYLAQWVRSEHVRITCGQAASLRFSLTTRITTFLVAVICVSFVGCLLSYSCKRSRGRYGSYTYCNFDSNCCPCGRDASNDVRPEATLNPDADSTPVVITMSPPPYEEIDNTTPEAPPTPGDTLPSENLPSHEGHLNPMYRNLPKYSSAELTDILPPPKYEDALQHELINEARAFMDQSQVRGDATPPPPYS